MKKDISQEELKPYRVIFNGDWDNYEEFANLEKAENFASRYTWLGRSRKTYRRLSVLY